MKFIIAMATAMIATATFAKAEGTITDLCGPGHANEVQSKADVQANPDGYYIRSLKIQLSNDDARIVMNVGNEFYICTRSAARPDMTETNSHLTSNEREVRFLFVPSCPPGVKPSA